MFEYEQNGCLKQVRGTFRAVLLCVAENKFLGTLPVLPKRFRLYVRGRLIENEYSWLDMFEEMAAGRARRVVVEASVNGSYRAKEVRNG